MRAHHVNVPTLTSEGCRSRQKKRIKRVDAAMDAGREQLVPGRIEHIYLITENGPEQLTRHNTTFAL